MRVPPYRDLHLLPALWRCSCLVEHSGMYLPEPQAASSRLMLATRQHEAASRCPGRASAPCRSATERASMSSGAGGESLPLPRVLLRGSQVVTARLASECHREPSQSKENTRCAPLIAHCAENTSRPRTTMLS